MIEQLTVFLENTKGRLTALCSALGQAGVNMQALVVADTSDYGIVRIICDKPAEALAALDAAGFRATIAEVIGVAVPHEPGGLAGVFEALDGADVNIEYSYCFTGEGGGATVALKAADPAATTLAAAGYTLVSQADLA